jgi:eukaryotic-like serine/threonine-protein kinase
VARLNFDFDGGSGHIGPYRLVRLLAQGGLGQVHLAESPDGRLVAVKVVRSALAGDPESRSALAREARAASQVDSPFTARFIDADIDGPVPWLASEYVPGPTLSQHVSYMGPLPALSLAALAAALAEGLGDIHAAGLVHRDLKPSNVILAKDRPRIVDFGLATTPESAPDPDGTVVGTPAYMSPEQATGQQVGPASDVFSLGEVLTFAAAATTPFHGGSVPGEMQRLLFADPDLVGVPDSMRPLIASCLAKDPAQRPTTAALRASAYAIAEYQFGLTAADVQVFMGLIPEATASSC